MTVKSELKKFMESQKVEKYDLDALVKVATGAVKAFAKNSKATMSGGRILMPLEYFGVETKHYVDNAVYPSVAETADMIRPAVPQTFPGLDMVGGAKASFSLPSSQLKSAMGMSNVKAAKKTFDAMFTKVLLKATSPKSHKKELLTSHVTKVLAQKQFAMLH